MFDSQVEAFSFGLGILLFHLFEMTYQDQLNQPEWAAKRQEILQRDDFKCTSCGAEKSMYEGWTVRFENVSSFSLSKYGYLVVADDNTDYSNLFYMGEREGGFATFISKVREPFSLKNVAFSERQWYQKRPKLVFYYSGDAINYQLGQLNIHHKYYISGNMAWQYENEALVTLCYDCHKAVHQNQQIEIKSLDFNPIQSRYAKNCIKCEGTGYLPEFSHIDNGICYPCVGRGVL